MIHKVTATFGEDRDVLAFADPQDPVADWCRSHRRRLPAPCRRPPRDITGARWRMDGAEAIVKLGALNDNADLAFHLAREHERRCPVPTSQHNYDLTA